MGVESFIADHWVKKLTEAIAKKGTAEAIPSGSWGRQFLENHFKVTAEREVGTGYGKTTVLTLGAK